MKNTQQVSALLEFMFQQKTGETDCEKEINVNTKKQTLLQRASIVVQSINLPLGMPYLISDPGSSALPVQLSVNIPGRLKMMSHVLNSAEPEHLGGILGFLALSRFSLGCCICGVIQQRNSLFFFPFSYFFSLFLLFK